MKIIITIVWIIISFDILGQDQRPLDFMNPKYLDNLSYFNARFSDSVGNSYNTALAQFCEDLANRRVRYTNEKAFLQRVFYKVQQHYLKRYNQYSTFEDLMEKGHYDCISGTALYALILSTLGFEIRIQETPFHTYLLVFLSNHEKVLIESTSAGQGFITDEKDILSTIQQFIALHKQEVPKEIHLLNRVISIKELAGLEKYNQAVYYFNHQNFNKSDIFLQKALELYPSQRIQALVELSQKYQNE